MEEGSSFQELTSKCNIIRAAQLIRKFEKKECWSSWLRMVTGYCTKNAVLNACMPGKWLVRDHADHEFKGNALMWYTRTMTFFAMKGSSISQYGLQGSLCWVYRLVVCVVRRTLTAGFWRKEHSYVNVRAHGFSSNVCLLALWMSCKPAVSTFVCG